MTDNYISIKINSIDDSVNDSEFSILQTRHLHSDLVEAGIENNYKQSLSDDSQDSKAFESIDWTTLLVSAAGLAGGLSVFANFMRNWIRTNPSNELKITLPNGASIFVKGYLASEENIKSYFELIHLATDKTVPDSSTHFVENQNLNLREKMTMFLSIDDLKLI